jgi:hypothetical protein
MAARKKIYYLPGMISLIGLPFLAVFFFPKPAPKLNAIGIFLPYDGKSDDKFILAFSKEYFYKSISKRNLEQIDLFENDSTLRNFLLRRKFDFISRELERISFTGDTTTVLKINLCDSNTLGDIVWLVYQTLMYNIRQWMIADNSFFFVNITRPP